MKRVIRKAILPAGGLGTRFLPATKASPKEMLPIVDKPMIQYAVEEAQSCGIEEFIIITGKHKRAIEDHFDSSFKLEESLKKSGKNMLIDEINRLNMLSFAYIRQREALGLGHAILCAAPFVKEEPFVVLLSDDIIDPGEHLLQEMIDLYSELNSPILALERVPLSEIGRYGVVSGERQGDGLFKISGLVEKPDPSDAPSDMAIIGRYVMTSDIFEMLENVGPGKGGEIQLTDALAGLMKKRPIYGYLFAGRRYDAGDKLGYLKATVDMAIGNRELSEQFTKFLSDTVGRIKNI